MKNNVYTNGNIICKGTGLKAYFQIPWVRTDENGVKEEKMFTYEVGTLQQILAETNRQSSWNYVAGRRNPVGVNKGIRNSYGTITFTQLDAGIINSLLIEVKKWNSDRSGLVDANLDGFSFENFTFNEQDKALIGGAEDDLNIDVYEEEVVMLDDLPPVDVIVIGNGDDIDPATGKYDVNKRYIFKCSKVTFLSETFGISAGAPLHNVATKCLILGGVEPWQEMKGIGKDGIK